MNIKRRIISPKLLLILGIIGPGIITATVDNDAGGIATLSVAGAHFGYSMLWSLIPITILLIVVQEMCARTGAVTGKGHADLVRENFGVKITFFIMVGAAIANLSVTVAEFAGIASVASLFNMSKFIFVPLTAIFVAVVTLKFNYKRLEKFFLLFILFYFSYVISAFMAQPDWGQVAHEMVMPHIDFTASYLVVLIALIGTTITPWMQFYLQASIVEKGLGTKEYKYTKWDVILGCISTDVITFFVIVTCAAVLFTHGISVDSAGDAAKALAPLAGQGASLLFAIGLFGASLFGAFIVPISTVFYVCEAFGWESGVNKNFNEARKFYIMFFLILAFGAILVLLPWENLISLMLSAQLVNGLILPFALIPVLLVANNKRIMGEYANSKVTSVFTWICLIVLIGITALWLLQSIFGFLAA